MPASWSVRILVVLLLVGRAAAGQHTALPDTALPTVGASRHSVQLLSLGRRPPQDVVDLYRQLFPGTRVAAHDSSASGKLEKFVWVMPTIGYTQQTRLLGQVAGNLAFRRPQANMSTVLAALSYTQNRQLILTVTNFVWSPANRTNWTGDWRIMRYPQNTFGLGMRTSRGQFVVMNFNYLRLYQSVLRRVGKQLYLGPGIQLDDHWNIVSQGPDGQRVTSISGYTRGINGRSLSVGPTLNLLHDTRRNAINPSQGTYLNLVARANTRLLGSDATYQTLLLDARTYLHPAPTSANVLALWSYSAITLHGSPPYLDLPSTGWDTYSNVGRGFIQGRFRGKNLLYAEAEYRFAITPNRLLGGVVFANAQTASENTRPALSVLDARFVRVTPAVGAGLRISLNKVSRTNLSIDYGVGADGSRGLAFNIGEVF